MKVHKSLKSIRDEEDKKDKRYKFFSKVLKIVLYPIIMIMRFNYKHHCSKKIKDWWWSSQYSIKKIENILREDIIDNLYKNYSDIIVYSQYYDELCWVENEWCEIVNFADSNYIKATDKQRFWLNKTSVKDLERLLNNIKFEDIYSKQVITCGNISHVNQPLPKFKAIVFSKNPITQDEYYYDE